MLILDSSNLAPFLPSDWLKSRLPPLEQAHTWLEEGGGPGGEFTGWVHLPRDYDREEFARIREAAERIRDTSDALVVVGIGGSYLGARAVLELLHTSYHNLRPGLQVFFAGNTLSSAATGELLSLLEGKDFSINVISKSGTTTEPAIAFRLFRKLLEERYGSREAAGRIYATTDPHQGALLAMAKARGYQTFTVPGNIGGRYSVLSAVGLLPLAAAGIDIEALMEGAAQAREALLRRGPENPAWQYAAARHALYEAGKQVELLAYDEPSFRFFGEWWKQLFGESEGKEGKGLFPATAEFPADLHSLGQYIQEGRRILAETFLSIQPGQEITIPCDSQDQDGLGYLSGKPLSFVARQAMEGTALAHLDGGVPSLTLRLAGRTPQAVGYLLWFFEFACGLSGHLLNVNPFDQPGVEAYKKNMFALLGKPGYEALADTLKARKARS